MHGNAVRRPARLVVLALATVVALSAILSGPASAARPLERRLLRYINTERIERGRPRLVIRGWLTRNARRHSRDMAAEGEWFHNDNLAGQLTNHVWSIVGENVGHGPTVASMHHWFMASPGHRANILRRDFTRVGLGIYREDNGLWVTEVFAA